MLEDILKLIAQYGFPIVLTVMFTTWFIVRVDKSIGKILGIVESLASWIQSKAEDLTKSFDEHRQKTETISEQQSEIIRRLSVLEAKTDK